MLTLPKRSRATVLARLGSLSAAVHDESGARNSISCKARKITNTGSAGRIRLCSGWWLSDDPLRFAARQQFRAQCLIGETVVRDQAVELPDCFEYDDHQHKAEEHLGQ